MAKIGKWTSGAEVAFPTTSYTAVSSNLFNTEVRNDDSLYSKSGSTITLDTSNDADGYIIRASFELEATHNNRLTVQARVVATSNSSNADVLASVVGQYSRNNTDKTASSDSFTVVTNISGPITFEAQWRRQGSGSPAGSVANSCLEIIPIYFDGIGLYEGTTNQLLGGLTPEVAILDNTIVESGNISRTSNSITLSADKKYLVMGCYYSERGGARTQRWAGIGEDGTLLRDSMTNIYIRDVNNGRQGEVFSNIIDTSGGSKDIDVRVYRGDGDNPVSLGGANITGNSPTTTLLSLAVIELKSGCEVFRSQDNTGVQNLGVVGDVEVDLAKDEVFSSSESFTKSDNTSYEAVVDMDAYIGANISASYTASSGVRITRRFEISKDGVGDITTATSKFGRGTQGGQSTYGFSGNPFGFMQLNSGQTTGVEVKDIGSTINVSTRAGWVGFWGVNLDTMNNSSTEPITRRFFSIT